MSVHQGDIDWEKVKSDSVEFAILRAGYGRDVSQKDAQFEKNYVGCKANTIPIAGLVYTVTSLSLNQALRPKSSSAMLCGLLIRV